MRAAIRLGGSRMKCITCPYAIWDEDMIIGCRKEDCNRESAIYDY